MKRPTITKKQAIAAMIEQINRDHRAATKAWREENDRLEEAYYAEVRRLLVDSERMTWLQDQLDDSGCELVNIDRSGSVTIEVLVDSECKRLFDSWQEHFEQRPSCESDASLAETLDAKLSGCDPQSLLSVPENVATIRALLNGLQLLPDHQ